MFLTVWLHLAAIAQHVELIKTTRGLQTPREIFSIRQISRVAHLKKTLC